MTPWEVPVLLGSRAAPDLPLPSPLTSDPFSPEGRSHQTNPAAHLTGEGTLGVSTRGVGVSLGDQTDHPNMPETLLLPWDIDPMGHPPLIHSFIQCVFTEWLGLESIYF